MSQIPDNAPGEETFTVMAIPADKVQAVRDFLASLAEDELDVNGFMLSRGGIGSAANAGKEFNPEPGGTICLSTKGGTDWNCLDRL